MYCKVMVLIASIVVTSVHAENITNAIFGSPSVSMNSANVITSSSSKAEMVDKGDFYFTNEGKKISFLRKKNEFLLVRDNRGKAASSSLANTIQAQFGNDVEIVKKHDFGNDTVVRLVGTVNKNSVISTIKSMDSSIEFVSPVLQNTKNTVSDVAVTSRIIVRLNPMVTPLKLINEASLSGKLALNAALKDAHQEYEFKIISPVNDAGTIFTLTREIMNLPYVKWAEPQMLVAPQLKFFPNDTLFNNQWHLHNTGQNGGVIDADIDAPEGWDLSKGDGAVVAVFDDGVQVSHPDLSIWSNPGETGGGKESNGIDDDANGYIDDFQGWDFGNNDNNPSPTGTDNHGTAVAGVAAAHGNNALGVTGSAINANILPVRSGSMSCTAWGDAMRYAGKYSDVVNNSWGISGCESSLNSAINDVVSGNIVGARRGTKGTPVLFATGNSASGWVRFSLSGFSAGTYNFRWEFSKDDAISEGYDTAWLDSISWPGGTTNNFEGDALGGLPAGFTGSGDANWHVVNDGIHARGASGKSVKAGTIANSQVTQLNITKTVGAGTLYYWAWVSSEMNFDFFNLYVDGTRYHHFTPGQGGHINGVGYPASNPDTIAVGGSQDGGPGAIEERTYYSQFGPEVDVVAPTNGGFQSITTTDRTGADGYDNTSDYTSTFGGTSSATPLTAGVVADILAYNPALTALQLRTILRSGTDNIGPYSYPGGRNDYYGYGRVNLLKALQLALPSVQDQIVKRADIAKPILLAKHGAAYTPPAATGTKYSDIQASDTYAAWVEELKTEGITEGCATNKYCPHSVVSKEQLAKLFLKAKFGSAYSPAAATGAYFTDITPASFAANWIEDLSKKNISDGCNASRYCPKDAVTLEGFEKMLNKVFP